MHVYAAAILLWWLIGNAKTQVVSPPPKPESVSRVTTAMPRAEAVSAKPVSVQSFDYLAKHPALPDVFSAALRQPVKPDTLKVVSGACPPLRKPPEGQYPPILKELISRVDQPDRFRDHQDPTDLVTWTHELSHGANSQVWNKKGKHGLYLLDGKGIVLPHPSITIEQVAHAIPPEKRGKIYKLYLVDQRRWWNDSPLYLLDEQLAYTHGAIAHSQMGWTDRRKDTYQSAREMEGYIREMLNVIERRDPDYPEMEQLRRLVDYQSSRLPKK